MTILKEILPFYERHSKKILFSFWFLFTLLSVLLVFITKGENATVSCILIVSFIGWAAIGIYLLVTKTFSLNKKGKDFPELSALTRSRLLLILDITFVGIFTCLLLILQICDARPLLYYILITVLLGCLVLSILLTESKTGHMLNLLKVLVFSALSSMAVFKQFYLSGKIDIGYFAALNEVTAELGYMPLELASKQMSYPFCHFAIAIAKILTNGDIQIATICGVVIPSIFLTLCVFAIAKHYLGTRYGLLAMLIANIPAYVIYLRYQANPTEWAWLYYLVLLLLVFLWVRSNGKLYNRFGILLVSFIILTMTAHQFSSFIVLFIVASLYIGSVLLRGNLWTRFTPLLLIYTLFMFVYWTIVPIGGLGFSISTVWSGLTSVKGENPLGLEPYVGMEPPTVLDSLLAETPMVVVQCICLLLPLLLLIAKSGLSETSNERKSYLWILIITLIGGLGFFSIIWVGYTGMTIRIGCYIAVIFALGLAFLFADFAARANANWKKVLHAGLVIGIVCVLGFVNIGAPMINDDTRLWREEYTITAEWSHADVVSADTLTSILPESYSMKTDWMYQYPVSYFSSAKKYIDNIQNINLNSKWYNQLLYFTPEEYISMEYVLFREKMMERPAYSVNKYGDTELESFTQIGCLQQNYQIVLSSTSNQYYDIGMNKLYQVN